MGCGIKIMWLLYGMQFDLEIDILEIMVYNFVTIILLSLDYRISGAVEVPLYQNTIFLE
jgi:hypothetical protein